MPNTPVEKEGPTMFAVVVCTRNRPQHLPRTLEALEVQTDRGFHTFVVDQSDQPDAELERRAAERADLTVLRDRGRGLSRARNVGWRHAASEWVVYVDDDCLPEPGWARELTIAIRDHRQAEMIGCYVFDHEPPSRDHVRVSVFEPSEEKLVRGRWTKPWEIGLGACIAIKRDALSRLGGFDERLGPGVSEFPGADDMDFNYRFLRSGGVAYVAPRARVLHNQWRTKEMLPALQHGYHRATAGLCMKLVKTGDVAGGLWLWWVEWVQTARFLASGIRRRSRLRVALVWPMILGTLSGTLKGMTRSW
jgi:GT2 family glycosyltransferase